MKWFDEETPIVIRGIQLTTLLLSWCALILIAIFLGQCITALIPEAMKTTSEQSFLVADNESE